LSIGRRAGLAPLVLAAILIVVVVVAGVGAYVFVISVPGNPGSKTTTTLYIGTTSTGTTSGDQYYKGNFTYIVPLGPSGINDSSGKPVQWNSTQTAKGSFTFSLNPATYIGSGEGIGSITVSTGGYCTGLTTVQYTFEITATHAPGENFEIGFDNPTPANVTVKLTCEGSTAGFYTANNPVAYLSVYPNLLYVPSIPTTQTQAPTEGISYTVTVTQA
jgi:hypothetical protein